LAKKVKKKAKGIKRSRATPTCNSKDKETGGKSHKIGKGHSSVKREKAMNRGLRAHEVKIRAREPK